MSDSNSPITAEQAPVEIPASDDPAEIARREAANTEALAHLAKMSGTGSSFGGTDYVAINTVAVASLILGFSSAMSLVLSLFLFLPVVGVACALLSIRQIRRSNGTQGGYSFAIGGIALCLLFGGISGTRELNDWLVAREQMRLAADVTSRFGKEIAAGNFGNAYDNLTTSTFRSRVAFRDFRAKFEKTGHGQITSIEWNHQPMLLEHLPEDELRATFLANVTFSDNAPPAQIAFRVSHKDDQWKIASLPTIFDEKTRQQRR